MNYAAISTNDNETYSFFTPLCCLFWRLHGFTPLLILVGTAAHWLADPRRRLVLERSREVGAVVHFTGDIAGSKTATVAQCARLFAAGLPGVYPDDVITTGDIDMLTLGPWVGGDIPWIVNGETRLGDRLKLYFSNAYSGGPCPHDGGRTNPCPCFPICYMQATARTWREIVGLEGLLDTTSLALQTMLVGVPVDDPVLSWNYDEKWLGGRIRAWQGDVQPVPRNWGVVQLIPRTFVKGEWRLDRSDWQIDDPDWRDVNTLPGLDGVADAHLPRPGFGEGWSKIRPLLELGLPPKMLAWCDDYHDVWMAS